MNFEDAKQRKKLTKTLRKLKEVDFLFTLHENFNTIFQYHTLEQIFQSECEKRKINYHQEYHVFLRD